MMLISTLVVFLCNMQTTLVIKRCGVMAVSGLLATHLLRQFILRCDWLTLPLKKAAPRLLLAAIAASALAGAVDAVVNGLFGLYSSHTRPALPTIILLKGIDFGLVILPRIENQRLALLLKERKLRSAESGIDIHVITASLNKIQALIGNNPSLARDEITEFSNLLRRGYLNTGINSEDRW